MESNCLKKKLNVVLNFNQYLTQFMTQFNVKVDLDGYVDDVSFNLKDTQWMTNHGKQKPQVITITLLSTKVKNNSFSIVPCIVL